MRISINGSALLARPSIDRLVDHARQASEDGFAGWWLAQTGAVDALTVLALAARDAAGLELGTAVIPTWPRHPFALAAQAATTQAATGGRLALGIGLSHQPVVEERWGIPFERPVRHMADQLAVLGPLLTDGKVEHRGDLVTCVVEMALPSSETPSILVAALGPQMLRLAGRHADGTVLWMVGPRTIGEHIAPTITAAAEEAGRPAPRIVCGLPVCVTSDVAGVRERAASGFTVYGQLPSYRAMLDREGVDGPADVAIVGDESSVADQLEAIFAAGATEFLALEFAPGDEERQRTRALLRSLLS